MASWTKVFFGCFCVILALSVVNVEAGLGHHKNSGLANLLVGGLLTLLFGELVGSENSIGKGLLGLSSRSNSESRAASPPAQDAQIMPRFAPLGNMPPLPLLPQPFGPPGGLPIAPNMLGLPILPGAIPQGRNFGNLGQVNGYGAIGPVPAMGNIGSANDIRNMAQFLALLNFGQSVGAFQVQGNLGQMPIVGNVGQIPATGNLKQIPVLAIPGLPLGGIRPGIHFGHLLGMGAFNNALPRYAALNFLQPNVFAAGLNQENPQSQTTPRFTEEKDSQSETENDSFDMQDMPFPNSEEDSKNDRRPQDSSFDRQNNLFPNFVTENQNDRRPQASQASTVNVISEWEKSL